MKWKYALRVHYMHSISPEVLKKCPLNVEINGSFPIQVGRKQGCKQWGNITSHSWLGSIPWHLEVLSYLFFRWFSAFEDIKIPSIADLVINQLWNTFRTPILDNFKFFWNLSYEIFLLKFHCNFTRKFVFFKTWHGPLRKLCSVLIHRNTVSAIK